MKRRFWKRVIALGMAGTMLLSMTACGGKNGGTGKQAEQEDTKNMVYAEDENFHVDGIEGSIERLRKSGDRFYLYTEEYPEYDEDMDSALPSDAEQSDEGESDSEDTAEKSEDESEENYDIIYRMYSVNKDGSDLQELGLPELGKNEYINNFYVDDSEAFSYLITQYDEKTGKQNCALVHADKDGKEKDRVDISKTLNLGDDEWIESTVFDRENRVYFSLSGRVVVLDTSGNNVCEVKVGTDIGYVYGMALTKDGQVVCGIETEDGSGVCAQILDLDKKAMGEKFQLEISYFTSSEALTDGVEYDFYYRDDKGVYAYDIAGKRSIRILDYVASDINSDSMGNPTPIDKDQMIGVVYTNGNPTKLVLYNKVDPSTIKDKEIITFGSVWSIDSNIRDAAIRFNKSNDKYKIQFKDYGDDEDGETKMNADIVAGNAPDIILLDYSPLDQYVQKGLLEDLTSYYEKDSDISLDDLIPSVEKAMQIDGKHYYTASSMSISSVVGATEYIGTEKGWTFEEFKALLGKQKKGAQAFFYNQKTVLLNIFSYMCSQDYVDWTTGKCSFDSDEFKSILEFCNTGVDEEMQYSDDTYAKYMQSLKDGTVLLEMANPSLEMIQECQYRFGGEVTFIGYPDKDRNGSYFDFNSTLGIYSKSNVKEGAWEFIKTLMTKEYQAKYSYIPTRKDVMDMKIKEATTTESYTDEFGNEITPISDIMGFTEEEQMKPVTQEQVDQFMDLVNRTTKVARYNTSILEIIDEEAKAYFNGQKSVDETADIIQNRVSTYVNESR